MDAAPWVAELLGAVLLAAEWLAAEWLVGELLGAELLAVETRMPVSLPTDNPVLSARRWERRVRGIGGHGDSIGAVRERQRGWWQTNQARVRRGFITVSQYPPQGSRQ